MRPEVLRQLLRELAEGQTSVEDAVGKLTRLPYEALNDAHVDHHRELRQGAAEVIYGAGKSPEQVASIAEAMLRAGSNVLCTRASAAAADAVRPIAPDVTYDELSRVLTVMRHAPARLGSLAVVCAGTSDLPVAREAQACATFFGAETRLIADVGVAGLHRLLPHLDTLRASDVLIVVAGMEGALPSVIGGLVQKPVIAVPTSVGYGTALGGFAALFGMLGSCASGITVVNIDNGFGAAAAAARILRT